MHALKIFAQHLVIGSLMLLLCSLPLFAVGPSALFAFGGAVLGSVGGAFLLGALQQPPISLPD